MLGEIFGDSETSLNNIQQVTSVNSRGRPCAGWPINGQGTPTVAGVPTGSTILQQIANLKIQIFPLRIKLFVFWFYGEIVQSHETAHTWQDLALEEHR